MNSIIYTYFISGQSPYIRTAIEAIESELYPVLINTDWRQSSEPMKSNKALYLNTRPTMDAGIVSGGFVGLCLFVGCWAGNKLLDEIYEKLKESLFRLFDKIHQNKRPSLKKRFEYQHIITFEDIGLTIIVRLPLDHENETSQSLSQMTYVHKIASEWLETEGKSAPIHCYVISDGKCNLEPLLYNSLEEVKRENLDQVVKSL